MKASPLAHLSKWRRLAPAVALLVVAFALVAGPVRQALAQDGPQAFAVYTADNTTLTLYKAEEVPSVGDTYERHVVTNVFTIDEEKADYTESPFAEVASQVTNVEIADCGENKVTPKSTAYWFDGFRALLEVDGWEYADTTQNTNTSYMYRSTKLTNGLSAPEFDTSSVRDMSYMFYGCSGLATPDFSSWNTSSVTDMSYMFYNCSSLTTPKLSGWDVSKVTDMSYMFYWDTKLQSLDLSEWNPASVQTTKAMFQWCSGMESINLSGWSLPALTDASSMFEGSSGGVSHLKTIDLSEWSASQLSNLSRMFYQSRGLTSVDLSSLGASGVTNTNNMFRSCSSLEEIDLSGLTMTEGANMLFMFDDCDELNRVTFNDRWFFGKGQYVGDNCYLPDSYYKYWYKLGTDDQPEGTGYKGEELGEAWDADQMAGTWVLADKIVDGRTAYAVYTEGDTTLTLCKSTDVPAVGSGFGEQSVTSVFLIDEDEDYFGTSPFKDVDDHVTFVSIAEPEDENDKLAPISMDHWFDNFTALEQVDGWENADTSSVTNMSYLFAHADLSKGFDAPNLDTSSVTTMSYMLQGCNLGATGPDLSNWDVSNVTDMSHMFNMCDELVAPNMTEWQPTSLTTMNYMFQDCEKLTTLNFSNWNTENLKYVSHAFDGASALTTVNAEGWNAPNLTNAQSAFEGCEALVELDLSDWGAKSLDNVTLMFNRCSKLETLNLDGVGSSSSYGMVFGNCPELSKVTLGECWSFEDADMQLPTVEGKLWYKADAGGNPTGEGYTPDELAAAWAGATMAGTWVLSEPISEPVVLEAFAVYCDTDKTLTLYKASDKPEEGGTYKDKAATQVFDINEETDWFSQTPFYSAKDSIERVIFAEPEDPNNKIAPVSMRKWFDSVNRLKSIEGWENVDGSNLTDMSYLFYGTRLESIDLSALKAPKLETIESMFESCLELKTANLSGLVTASTTHASNLFLGCSNLESVDVSKWDTSGMESMTSVFHRCRDLTELDLSSWTTTDAVNMKWMFNDSGITKVTLGTGFSFGSGPSQTGLPDAKGCLWYKLDDSGSPVLPGYTGEELATSWNGSTMAGTWQLTKELEEPKPKPVELAGLPASDSLTYGETLTVTFTPKSGDDVVTSGTATLKLGDKVLATSSEPQADGSFSLSYNTADKGVALGEQALTVTFESAGYEAATGNVETTLSAKALTVEVTSSLDKTWDGSDEVKDLAVVLLGAFGADDVTVSATGAYASSDAGEQDVTLTLALSGDDAAWYTVSAPTDLTGTINAADIAGKLSLSGTPAFGETLAATYEPASGEQVSYAWTRDGQVIDGATGSTYTLTKEDVGAQIAVVAAASDANHTGSVTSDAVAVAKATQDAPAAPVATATSHTTIEVEALADSPAGAKAEYSIDGGKTWQTETTFSGLEPETEYTVIARFQELDTHEASEVSEGTTVSTPVAPSEPDPDDPDTPDTPDPDEPDTPDTPDTPETPDPDKPADTKPSEQPKPEIPATGDAGAAAALVTALAGAGALGLGAHRRRS